MEPWYASSHNWICEHLLNQKQHPSYEEILTFMVESRANVFFLYDLARTGKTILYDVLIANSTLKIELYYLWQHWITYYWIFVIEFLSRSKTTHLTFKLPISTLENFVYFINKQLTYVDIMWEGIMKFEIKFLCNIGIVQSVWMKSMQYAIFQLINNFFGRITIVFRGAWFYQNMSIVSKGKW